MVVAFACKAFMTMDKIKRAKNAIIHVNLVTNQKNVSLVIKTTLDY